MICYLCHRYCDLKQSGLCDECTKKVSENSEKVYAYSLLKSAEEFCPVWLREKIENFWETTKVSSRFPAE